MIIPPRRPKNTPSGGGFFVAATPPKKAVTTPCAFCLNSNFVGDNLNTLSRYEIGNMCENQKRNVVNLYMEKLGFTSASSTYTYEYMINVALSNCGFSCSGNGLLSVASACADPICVFNGIMGQINADNTTDQEKIKKAFLQYGLGLSAAEVAGFSTDYIDYIHAYTSNTNFNFCLNGNCYLNNRNTFNTVFDEMYSSCSTSFDLTNSLNENTQTCNCNVDGNNNWVSFDSEDPFLAPEPKWGQLGTCEDIKDQIFELNISGLSIKEQATAIQQHLECNVGYNRDGNGCLFIDESCNGKRYVYSYLFGWIDFHHVFVVFEWAVQANQFTAILGDFTTAFMADEAGYAGEVFQWLKNKYDSDNPNFSAFSYEDICSNMMGAWLFANCYDRLASGEIDMQEAIDELCTYLDTTNPENAPNYEFIPHILNEQVPQIFTVFSCLTGDELYNAAKAEFCQKNLEQQLRIQQVHDEFEH